MEQEIYLLELYHLMKKSIPALMLIELIRQHLVSSMMQILLFYLMVILLLYGMISPEMMAQRTGYLRRSILLNLVL